MALRIVNLLRQMDAQQASDLFIKEGCEPAVRTTSGIFKLDDQPVEHDDLSAFLDEHLPGIQERLDSERDLDIGLSLSATERFRLNLYYQKGRRAVAARRVPSGALDMEQLHIPPIAARLAESPRGLVILTGAAGSGKSTTMAAMLHYINTQFSRHIVTIEDPIEFVHQDGESIISQREIGTDTADFGTALRHVVRQDPDVIFIGEMRDLETMRTAISAALTGHLVVSTMHTVDARQTLERIVNYFPPNYRDQVALDFSLALSGILSQRLLPRQDTRGVVPVFEVLTATPLIRQRIAGQQFDDMEEIMRAGADDGMQTFSRALVTLCRRELVSKEQATAAATNREEFLLALEGMETGIDTLRQGREGQISSGATDIKTLLHTAVRQNASDLHLSTNRPPLLRISGDLQELEMEPLQPQDTRRLLFSVLTPAQRSHFEAHNEIDFALSVSEEEQQDQSGAQKHRFRVNGFYEKGAIAAAFRIIPQSIPEPADLLMPTTVLDLADHPHGLVLVSGATGHGKSTTLACMIEHINRKRACHVVTIEDPIEFVHTDKQAVIQQREVHADTHSFGDALKYILRQDPDVILIGEMRDQETMAAALTAAETGHLVLATLHTSDAVQTVERIIDAFPGHQQHQIRTQLADSLAGVVAQRLLPSIDGSRRVAAFEILLGKPAVKALIRDQKTHQIHSVMETSARSGMVTMDRALQNLQQQGYISEESVRNFSRHNQPQDDDQTAQMFRRR